MVQHVNTESSKFCAADGLAALEAGLLMHDQVMPTELGGVTFKAGTYSTADPVNIILANPIMYLDAEGNSDAVFIFNAAQTVITCTGSEIVLLNGAKAENVYWFLGAALTVGSDSTFVGNVLAKTAITVGTHSVLIGKAIAQTAVSCATGCTIGTAANCLPSV